MIHITYNSKVGTGDKDDTRIPWLEGKKRNGTLSITKRIRRMRKIDKS